MIAGLERMLDLTTGKTEYPDLKSCSGAKSMSRLDDVRLMLQAAFYVQGLGIACTRAHWRLKQGCN
jgi:hypothetical protein